MNKEKLIIFDTTLRDGKQSPGASMTRDEKIRIAGTRQVNIDRPGEAIRAATSGRTHPQLGNL